MDKVRVTAIVPVYNEEKTVKNVLSVLDKSKLVNEIIVVDDASKDNSLKAIREFKKGKKKVRIVALKKNRGKGGAVKEAAKNLRNGVVFLCDADLVGLKTSHVTQILKPFKTRKKIMSAGLRDYGRIGNSLYARRFMPLIAGERAMSYQILREALKNPLIKGYGLETVLNHYCKKNSILTYRTTLKGLQHITKTKKWEKKGVRSWVKEMAQVGWVMMKIRKEKT